jgi:hypothetical protein
VRSDANVRFVRARAVPGAVLELEEGPFCRLVLYLPGPSREALEPGLSSFCISSNMLGVAGEVARPTQW